MSNNLLIKCCAFFPKYFLQKLASHTPCAYICTTIIKNGYAKVAQLVERDLAKVEVAGSNPVFRSEVKAPETVLFFSICHPNRMDDAGVVELVDTQDLKSCEPKRSYGFDSRPRYKASGTSPEAFFFSGMLYLSNTFLHLSS